MRLAAVSGLVVALVAGFAGYQVISGASKASNHASVQPAAAAAPIPSAGTGSLAGTGGPSATGSPAAASPGSASIPPSATASPAPAAERLRPASVRAFGAGGAAGDDPQGAHLVVAAHRSAGWVSDWYTTPEFGGLTSGTGLMLDMGRKVAVSAVTVELGGARGGKFEIRASDVVGHWRTVATSATSAWTIRLRLSQVVRARYLLLWFTKLPPDGHGTYQVRVRRVTIRGYKAG